MHRMLGMALSVAMLTMTLGACAGDSSEDVADEVASQATSVTTTVAPTTSEAASTSTTMPATMTTTLADPDNLILLTANAAGASDPIKVEVVAGELKLVSGTTAREGSSLSVQESWIELALGLGIDIGPGGLELFGERYEAGTRLIVGPSGTLQVVGAASAMAAEPEPTLQIIFEDQFDGALNDGWSWVLEDADTWNMTAAPGWLQITATDRMQNLLVRDAPGGVYEVTTALRFRPTSNFQFAGLTVAPKNSEATFLQLGRAYCDPAIDFCIGDGVYLDNVENGEMVGSSIAEIATGADVVYLRLVVDGDSYAGYLSGDGDTWTLVGEHTHSFGDAEIGLIAHQAYEQPAVAQFDYFTVTTTATTGAPTTTIPSLLADQEWPDPIYATEGPIIVWREDFSQFLRLLEEPYASNPGFPPKHWLPEETSIAPLLMEDALYMCDELTEGRQPDDIFMEIIRNRKDYPWPEANFATFKLMIFSLSAAGVDGSFCPEHNSVIGNSFLGPQLEGIKNVDSPHYEEFANCTPEKGCEKWKDGRPQEYS